MIRDRFDCEILVNNVKFTDNIKLKKDNYITYIFNNKSSDLGYMFKGCELLKSINLDNFNTNKVTDMRCMFSGCSSLESINLDNFNTNNVTNM